MTNELIGCRTCPSPYCKGCNMFTLYKALEAGKFDALMSENRALYDSALDNLERDRWISVEERLPEEDKTVLTWGKQGVILLDWRHDNKWCCFGEVTHWMPLPEPPKEET